MNKLSNALIGALLGFLSAAFASVQLWWAVALMGAALLVLLVNAISEDRKARKG